MIFQAGDRIPFAAHYTDSDGISAAGLTVNVNIWQLDIASGSISRVVTNGQATEAGDGIYYYLYTTPDSGNYQFYAVFSTDDNAVQMHDLAATGQSGAPWVQHLNEDLSDLTPEKDWTYPHRTLTANVGGVTIISAVAGDKITVYAFDTWSFIIEDSNFDLSSYDALAFVVKASPNNADEESILYIRSDTGLQIIDGHSPQSSSNGELTFTATSFSISIDLSETGVEHHGSFTWWLKGFVQSNDAVAKTLATGMFIIKMAGLQATS